MNNQTEIDTSAIQDLYDMLTGRRLPDGITLDEQPQLTPTAAFSVIYYLQEVLRIIPDDFAMCAYCEIIFDTRYGGDYVHDDAYEQSAWYKDCEFTEATVKACIGLHFCDSACEANHMSKVQYGGK